MTRTVTKSDTDIELLKDIGNRLSGLAKSRRNSFSLTELVEMEGACIRIDQAVKSALARPKTIEEVGS